MSKKREKGVPFWMSGTVDGMGLFRRQVPEEQTQPHMVWTAQWKTKATDRSSQSQNFLGFKLLLDNMVAFLRTFLPWHGHALRFSTIIEDQGSAKWHAQSAMLCWLHLHRLSGSGNSWDVSSAWRRSGLLVIGYSDSQSSYSWSWKAEGFAPKHHCWSWNANYSSIV